MSMEEAVIKAYPPPPRGVELDERSRAVQQMIGQTRHDAHPVTDDDPDPNRPYFVEGSTLRMAYKEPLVPPIAHVAAFALGMTDERNATTTIDYMKRNGHMVKSNANRAYAFRDVVTGSRDTADPVIDAIFVGHVRVHNEAMGAAAGPHPERVAYDPFVPEGGSWTVASLGWSTKEVFGALVRPFSEAEDRVFEEVDLPLFGGLFGSEAPKDTDGLDSHGLVRQRLADGDLQLTEAAKIVAMQNWHYLTVPRLLMPFRKYGVHMILGLLPEEVRDMYGLEYGPQQEEEFAKAVSLLSVANRIAKMTRISVDSRLFRMAAKEEKRQYPDGRADEIPDPYAQAA
jgi:uncharacterized protein (DUF2236 family)